MERITVRLYGRDYALFRFKAFEGTPRETEVTVAEHKLNAIVEKRIRQGRYPEVRAVDEMYGYYLPKEIDTGDEREIRESIESAMDGGEDINSEFSYRDQLVRRMPDKYIYFLYNEDGDIDAFSAPDVKSVIGAIDARAERQGGLYNADGEIS